MKDLLLRRQLFARLGVLFLATLALPFCIFAQSDKPAPDTLILHGRVYTENPAYPWAEAVAIHDGKILAVGTDAAIAKLGGNGTKVIDAGGHLVLPGFVDCHIHFMEGSLSLGQVNLEGAKDIAEIQERLRAYAKEHPGADWLLGHGWNYAMFGAETLPNKKYLDELFPDRPVLLDAYDGHTAWANSKALQMAAIDRSTANPPNGVIVRDPRTLDATGTLKESAQRLVDKLVPEPTRAERLAALRAGMKWANEHGLTRVHSAGGDFSELDLYEELRRNNEMTLRFYIAYFMDPPAMRPQDLEAIETAGKKYHDEWIDTNAVKFMIDGVIESHTAAMLAPYSDDASLQGKLFWEPAKYREAVTELDKRGLQIFTHAIGDLGVRTVLDAYENAEAENHGKDHRPRIEHIETITAADIPRFGKLGVIASMQPLHAYPDDDTLRVWAGNIGVNRASRAWVWNSIANDGGKLAFGSDWPVVTLDPWAGVQTAVTRQTTDGKPEGGFIPRQKLTVAEAVHGYTLGAAFAGRREQTEGSIEPGKLADIIILSQNIFEIPLQKIAESKVLTTIVGGRVVFESAEKTSGGKP
jgi:predicted amidohydrolase YtcJ